MKLTAILSALMLTTFTFSAIAAGNTAATTETSASMQNKKKAENAPRKMRSFHIWPSSLKFRALFFPQKAKVSVQVRPQV